MEVQNGFSLSTGEEDLRFEEKDPGAGEVQVCAGLQDQRAEEADRAQGERRQGHEGANPGGESLCRSNSSTLWTTH